MCVDSLAVPMVLCCKVCTEVHAQISGRKSPLEKDGGLMGNIIIIIVMLIEFDDFF